MLRLSDPFFFFLFLFDFVFFVAVFVSLSIVCLFKIYPSSFWDDSRDFDRMICASATLLTLGRWEYGIVGVFPIFDFLILFYVLNKKDSILCFFFKEKIIIIVC